MVIDTSALAAILFDEPECESFLRWIAADEIRLIAAPTRVETGVVLEARKGQHGRSALELLIREAEVETVPFDSEHAELALDAWRRFGKGRHEAGLNFGDCFAYALAAASGEPLLFKGDDFSKTDVLVAGQQEQSG